MPWITNVSLRDVEQGNHPLADNAILIQIVDCGMEFPTPQKNFKAVFQFQFLDVERKDTIYYDEMKFTPEQAYEISRILLNALSKNLDVVVHCVAGVSRSGAVAEVGAFLGFEDLGSFRSPNLMVKHSLLESLGLPYDNDEKYTITENSVTKPLHLI